MLNMQHIRRRDPAMLDIRAGGHKSYCPTKNVDHSILSVCLSRLTGKVSKVSKINAFYAFNYEIMHVLVAAELRGVLFFSSSGPAYLLKKENGEVQRAVWPFKYAKEHI
jgi:hypothetical protein